MQQVVYIVSEVQPSGYERTIAVRLTHRAAQAIAASAPRRKVTKFIADKEEQLSREEEIKLK